MARKKRADEVAELRARLRAQTDVVMEVEPLLPIAQALQEAIEARLQGEAGDSPLDVDAAWDSALQEVAERLIASELAGVDPERVLRLYAERFGDEALAEKLGRWVGAKSEELDFAHRMEQARAAAGRSGTLPLAKLDPDLRISIGMFDPAQAAQAQKEGPIPPVRTIAFRLIDPRRGYAEVVHDTVLPFSAATPFATDTRGTIGSEVVEHGLRWLEPVLQVHAPLGYDFGSGTERTPQVIGFVEAAAGLLLLDGDR